MNEPPPVEDRLSFSLSGEEAEDTTDSLDIKPPQAAAARKVRHKKDKVPSRPDKHGYRKREHTRSDERRKDYKPERSRSERDRDFHHSKERRSHHGRRERTRSDRDRTKSAGHKEERHGKKLKESISGSNEKLLEDLRGKLLEKKQLRESENEPERKRSKKEKREKMDREREEAELEQPMETEKEKAERLEREERRAKLLEAEREMALRKEVSRRELQARRERQNIEKEKSRMLREIVRKNKLEVGAENNSEEEMEDEEEDEDDDDGELDENEEESSDDSDSSSTGSSETDDSTDQETKEGTPESAPPLEKSPRTPKQPLASGFSSRDVSPGKNQQRSNSEEAMEVDEEEQSFVENSPKIDIVVKEELPPYLPALQGCRSVEEFQCLNRIEEGTYGVVYRARDKRTQDIVALKRLKMEKEKEGFPITSLREINTLLKAQHPNIVTVREIVVGSNMDKIFIVMDYVEHDLKSLMETMKSKKQVFLPGEIKCLMIQLLRAVAHLHDNWILHRDLKTSNLLLSHKGILKVGDFGLAREYGSPLKNYTPIVVTLWYRAPELLLQAKEYSTAIDVWSVGCIFGELLQMSALFNGTSEMNQLNKIFKELGTPNEKSWPGCSKLPAFQKVTFADFPVNQIRNRFGSMLSELGLDLINKFLTYDPTQRITAEDALKHNYFKEVPLPIDPAMFPTWPAKSEQGVKKANNSPKPPSGGKAYKQLGDTDDEVPSGGFHMAAERRTLMGAGAGAGFSLRF